MGGRQTLTEPCNMSDRAQKEWRQVQNTKRRKMNEITRKRRAAVNVRNVERERRKPVMDESRDVAGNGQRNTRGINGKGNDATNVRSPEHQAVHASGMIVTNWDVRASGKRNKGEVRPFEQGQC
ncbi:hypothetical protein R1flu_022658 [Riccia fluitans]|uniref:Uncharacterized protein n=1 Tax=Riccia fluitans TaxID=41844 RepID=A0ABD1XSQ1_9MARC